MCTSSRRSRVSKQNEKETLLDLFGADEVVTKIVDGVYRRWPVVQAWSVSSVCPDVVISLDGACLVQGLCLHRRVRVRVKEQRNRR